jgi:hypothetical protein
MVLLYLVVTIAAALLTRWGTQRTVAMRVKTAWSALQGNQLIARDRAALDHRGGQVVLSEAAQSPNALVVFANPANCAINREWAQRVSRAVRLAHLKGVMLVSGFTDSVAARAAVQDLGLDFEVHLVSPQVSSVLIQQLGIPALALVRSHEVVLVANSSQFEAAPTWIQAVLEMGRVRSPAGVSLSNSIARGQP